jgi:hypothetical protein
MPYDAEQPWGADADGFSGLIITGIVDDLKY